MPTSRSPSQTGSDPTSSCFIFSAACSSVASGRMTSTSRLITSFSCIPHLLVLLALLVALFLVVLEHRPRRHFLGALAVAAGLLRLFLDVFVLALLFLAHAAHVL